jgi:hypothetical protein
MRIIFAATFSDKGKENMNCTNCGHLLTDNLRFCTQSKSIPDFEWEP